MRLGRLGTVRDWQLWAGYLAGWTLIALVLTGQAMIAARLAHTHECSFGAQFQVFLIWAYLWAGTGAALWKTLQRFPVEMANVKRTLPLYLGSMLLGAAIVHPALYVAIQVGLGFVPAADIGHMLTTFLAVYALLGLALSVAMFGAMCSLRSYQEQQRAEVNMGALRRQLAETKLAVLKAQLEPHFIFNCLNSVNSLIPEDPEAASEMLADFSDLLRSSLKDLERPSRSLREELEFVKLYLEICRRRCGDFLMKISVPEPLLDLSVPTMLLQPIVENAVIHGLSQNGAAPRYVRIEALQMEGVARISVTNSGPWKPESNGARVGLKNVAERLTMQFGEAAGLFHRQDESSVEILVDIPNGVAA